jgi:hypothetical protein
VSRDSIWLDIITERFRQKRLMSEGKFDRDMADPTLTATEKLTVCSEEFGEVARIVCEGITKAGNTVDTPHLREELIQLATCCVAWVEEIDGVPQELTLDQLRDAVAGAAGDTGWPLLAFAVEGGAS